MDKNELAQQFNEAQQDARNFFDAGTIKMLEDLSQGLADLQDIGIDVTVDFSAGNFPAAWNLFGLQKGYAQMIACGILNIEGAHHRFAIAKNSLNKNHFRIAISSNDIRHEKEADGIINNSETITSDTPIPDIQKFIIKKTAFAREIQSHDVAQSFKGKDGFNFGKPFGGLK